MNGNKRQFIILVVCLVVLGVLVAIGFRTSAPEKPLTVEEKVNLPRPSAEVEKLSFSENTKHYEINATYPKTNSDTISLFFKNFITEQVAQFKDDTSWVSETDSASSGSLTLDIEYKIVNSGIVENYVFNINTYTGGAHGIQAIRTFTYDKTGELLTLADMFSNGLEGLKVYAVAVQKELSKRPGIDTKWLQDGSSPTEENYSAFIATDQGLTVIFSPYQVAPYSEGTIEITVPVSAFAKVANPEVFPPNL